MHFFCRSRTHNRKPSDRGYYEPRVNRGLSDRIFLDSSRRRKSRVLFSLAGIAVGVVVWLAIFATMVGMDRGLEAALPEPISVLKGRNLSGEVDAFVSADPSGSGIAAVDLHAQQEAQKYVCLKGSSGQAAAQARKVFAVVPADLPWAAASLEESCDTIDVALPTWFRLSRTGGSVQIEEVTPSTRDPLYEYAAKKTDLRIMPVIQLDASITPLLEAPQGAPTLAQSLVDFIDQPQHYDLISGFCLDVSLLTNGQFGTFNTLVRTIASALKRHSLTACIRLPSSASDSSLIIADRFFDTVIVNGYQEYWIGSAPNPLAGMEWFEEHIASVQEHVTAEKLVVELGTHSVDWVSRRPRPEKKSFAQVMSALAKGRGNAEFDAAEGNTRIRHLDDKGLQHQVWMLDAASMQNQILALQKRGVPSISLSGLGLEDPGIWAVIDHAAQGLSLSEESLRNIVVSEYVEHLGEGPFVAPLSMPHVGQRTVSIDPNTHQITAVNYHQLPQAGRVQLYGAGEPNKVVLTFDDGPHPQHTATILDILRATNTPGSFFVLGSNAVRAPDLVKRILAEGHELGSHTYSHPNMGAISASRATVEINSTQHLLAGITGKNIRLYREPYMRSGGPISSREVASLMPLEEAGYVIAGMNVVPRDWITQTADALANEIIRQVEENAGGVVLLHDGGGDQSQTAAALPEVILELRARGYVFTSLADFLGVSPESLMPKSNRVKSMFGNVSFSAMGGSWSLLQMAFWIVFVIGVTRSIALLLLTAKHKRHVPPVMRQAPSVSIVIPAYNEERVIEACIRKALYTEYANFDIIVVDDGSTDDTYLKAASFAYHPLVKVLRQPNRGKAAALNAALDESESDILICIDADSQIAPDALSLLASHFEDPQVGAVAGRVVVGNRLNLLTRLQALEYITSQAVERRAKDHLNAITVVPGAIGAWRATALMEAGIYSTETLTEDADMTMAIIRTGYQVVYEDRAIATTETPFTLKALMTQRLRWSLGMMQAGWKHLGAVMEPGNLGRVALPDLAIFGYLMPLIAPLADLFLVILLIDWFANWGAVDHEYGRIFANPLIIAYLALPALEVLNAVIAFQLDAKEDRRLLWLLPFQRVFYRQILYVSVIRAIWRAATGSLASWGRITRFGFKYDLAKTT